VILRDHITVFMQCLTDGQNMCWNVEPEISTSLMTYARLRTTRFKNNPFAESDSGACLCAAAAMLEGKFYPMCRKTPCFSCGDIRHVHRIYASK
jgi:hypothetical protein